MSNEQKTKYKDTVTHIDVNKEILKLLKELKDKRLMKSYNELFLDMLEVYYEHRTVANPKNVEPIFN